MLTTLLFLLFVSFTLETNPGVKFGFPKKTLDYMSGQIFPWVEKKLQNIELPNIEEKVHTPVGHVKFEIKDGKIEQFQIANPTYKIISASTIQITLPDVHLSGKTDWKYREDSFPHVKDSGHLDLDLLADIKVTFGAVINKGHQSNIEIVSSGFSLSFKEFHIKVHGGASWIYNMLIKEFKGKLEDELKKLLEKDVPKEVVDLLQPIIDSMSFTYPVGLKNVDFSYEIEEIKFQTSQSYMMFGALGCLLDGTTLPPGQASVMPDIYADTTMIQAFFSEWTFSSSMWAAQHAGLMHYTVEDSSKLPIHLDTNSFSMFIPGLKKFGDKEMQVQLGVKAGTTPSFQFTPNLVTMSGTMDAVFQVKNTTTQNIDVFTLDSECIFNATVQLIKGKEDFTYKIAAKLGLEKLNITLVKSSVGSFDPKILQNMFTAMIDNFVLPNLNKFYLDGVPLPSTKYFQPINPKLTFDKGYLVATFDFNFFPPPM